MWLNPDTQVEFTVGREWEPVPLQGRRGNLRGRAGGEFLAEGGLGGALDVRVRVEELSRGKVRHAVQEHQQGQRPRGAVHTEQ